MCIFHIVPLLVQWSLYRKANRFAEHFWPHKGVQPHERGNFSNADGSYCIQIVAT